MKPCIKPSFSERILHRNRILTVVLILMFVYMIVIGELKLGDSRMMSPLAELASRVIFFGGMIYVFFKIRRNKKLLSNPALLKKKMLEEKDEMRQHLYEKSGGVVWDIVLICQLFITLTTSLVNMQAFYSALTTLLILLAVKAVSYGYFQFNGN